MIRPHCLSAMAQGSFEKNCKVLGLLVLALQVPWPGPSVFKISCPRESARLVRKIVTSKWTPVLARHGVSLPLDCPFHSARDVYAPQEAAKQQHRASQWTCGLCGKSFFEEKHLDLHFDARHKGAINTAEDAVCLADYCDIMRCEVLLSQDAVTAGLVEPTAINTDVEIWREATAYRTALAVTPGGASRDLVRISIEHRRPNSAAASVSLPAHRCGLRSDTDNVPKTTDELDNKTASEKKGSASPGPDCKSDMVDSTLPPVDRKHQYLSELKANCKPEELHKLKVRCEILVRDCIAGLLVQLSVEDFQQVEEELNRAVCWFLTCDRYWEDHNASDGRSFPWGLLFLTVMVLSLGLCLCYYVVWVLFDGDDGTSVTSTSGSVTAPSSPARPNMGDPDMQTPLQPDEYNEHYIYVTYPPELKRRLLESCYNRTTRL